MTGSDDVEDSVEVPAGSVPDASADAAAKKDDGGDDDADDKAEKGFASEDNSASDDQDAPTKKEGDGGDDGGGDETAKEAEETAPADRPSVRTLSDADEQFKSHRSSLAVPSAVDLPKASWWRQFKCVLWKNCLQLSRRPVTLFLTICSSIISVILAWAAGQDDRTYPFPELTECNTVPVQIQNNWTYINEVYGSSTSNIPLSLNEKWRNGLPVAVMMLGPMLTAICVFFVVHAEMNTKMLGVLRALGLRDSAYWLAWYVPFLFLSLVNSLLGAAVATGLPIHVFQNTTFAGPFASLFFLQVALIPASFFVAAICGSAKAGAPWLVLVMLLCVWVPYFAVAFGSAYPRPDSPLAPQGMFWVYGNTTYTQSEYINGTNVYTECQRPILSQDQGTWYKTKEEQEAITKDEYFVGCYHVSSYFSMASNNPGGVGGLVPLFMFPYWHFAAMWGNILGYTGMPGKRFDISHASMSPEELAVAALPSPPDPARSNGTTLYPQASTLNTASYYNQYEQRRICDEYGQNCYYTDTCPASDAPEGSNFCNYLSNCQHGAEPSPTTNTPSFNDSLGYLVLLAVIYSLLAAYWAQVFPCGNGAGQRWYFFVMPSYWCGESNKADDAEDGDGRRSSLAAGGGVTVKDVRKRFGDFEAIKGVSLQMGRGEVTALLGHNGAGKTTLSNILTCEMRPTEGDIYVFGKSVNSDQYAVRSMVGVCRQDDYLWSDMSAREHLELFGGLRGVDPEKLPGVVQKWLESVDLDEVQLGYSSSFSGGMKRRLSVALATIGDRPLIVLDEPTTGMDPVSRRFVWRHIDEIKEDRVVLLTTHAMEEADLLADMVAIMRKGDLAAFGSPLQLKADHGSALQFSVLVEKASVQEAADAIRSRFEAHPQQVTLEAGEAGNITVNIQSIQQNAEEDGIPVNELSDFVAWLDSSESGVLEYGFSNSSLEEVFLKVTEGEKKGDADEDDENDVDVCCPCCCRCCIGCCLKGCCRCCCKPKPRIKEVTDEGTDKEGSEEGAEKVSGSAADVRTSISGATFTPNLTVQSQLRALLKFTFERHWTGKSSIANYVMFSFLVVFTIILGIMTDPSGDLYFVLVIPVAFLSFMLMSIIGPIYTDRAEGLFYIQRTQGMLARSHLLGTGMYAFLVQFAYAFLLLSLFFATPLFRDPVICSPDASSSYQTCQWNPGDPPTYSFYTNQIYWYQDGDNKVYAVTKAGNYGLIFGTIALFALSMPGGTLSSSYVPGKVLAIVLMTFILLLVCVAPLWFYATIQGSAERGLECEAMLGWAENGTCTQTYNSSMLGTEFLDCVGASVSLSRSALCVPSVASIMSQFGAFQSLSLTLQSEIYFWSDPPSYTESVFIPSIQSGGGDCSGNVCKFPMTQPLYGQTIGFWFLGAVLTLILGILLACFFSFPTGPVLRYKNMFSQFFGSLRCKKKPVEGKKVESTEPELEEVTQERQVVRELVKPLLSTPEPEALEAGNAEDENPIIVNHSDIPRGDVPPALMYKLRKVYPSLGGRPPKEALKSLSLHVPKGQVLGLLGKNGAGKTTALKILSCAHDSSGGLALVAGYDVSCERISVFERLGNCAQFDVVWKNQSIQRHLEFFARLKGMPNDKVKEAALSIATAVGLGAPEVYRRHAGQLSGGMRRRLSIAISLIGAPSVLLLDEPSTGLDPSTRNSIWALVNSFATEERAIIITTHMMIEADTLCQRIAIVSQGELKVVATQQHLKNEYGSGYLLQLNLVRSSEAAQESAMSFVRRRLHKDAVLGIKQAKTIHIQLPRDLDLQRVFSALYSPESTSEGCINQFLLSQSSLEDVFIALGD